MSSKHALASVIQPIYAGGFHPTLDLRADGDLSETSPPFAQMKGPWKFAGSLGSSFSNQFPISFTRPSIPVVSGDVAMLTKETANYFKIATELTSGSDIYTAQFASHSRLTINQKLSTLLTLLMIDNLYFQKETQRQKEKEYYFNTIHTYTSCFGCIRISKARSKLNQTNYSLCI